MKLLDIAEIIGCRLIEKEDYSESGINVITHKNIKENRVIGTDTFVKEDSFDKYSKQSLKVNDIVVPKTLGNFDIGVINESNLPAIASNNLIIIRPKLEYVDSLLKIISDNELKTNFLKSVEETAKGSAMPVLNLRDLGNIEVNL